MAVEDAGNAAENVGEAIANDVEADRRQGRERRVDVDVDTNKAN